MYHEVDKDTKIEALANSYNIYIEALEIDSTFNVYVIDDVIFSEMKYLLYSLMKEGVYYIEGEIINNDVFDRFSTLPYRFPKSTELTSVTQTYLNELYKAKNKEEEFKVNFKEKLGIDFDEFKKYLNK